jgi:SAM-dependent methyltransferase
MREKSLSEVNMDSDRRIMAHKQILSTKPMLRDVFDENFRLMEQLAKRHLTSDGDALELGSGAVSLKKILPTVITSDVMPSEYNDRCIDAMDMDIRSNSLSAIFAQNVFHHIPNPEKFFHEADRVLRDGGGVIMIEPFYGPLASFIYRTFISDEIFDPKQQSWKSQLTGPMLGANQALSYIVFKRDKHIFEEKFPQFEIVETVILNNFLRYILSGGLNFSRLLPDWLAAPIRIMEFLLKPLNWVFGIHYVLVLRKKCG